MKREAGRAILLCIDSYENNVPKGRFCGVQNEECCSFHSTVQMLRLIEQKLDILKFPQAFESLRSFAPAVPAETAKEAAPVCRGSSATFSIRILFRQNASWQGTLTWIEGGQESCFRSALELIFLMDSVFRLKAC